MRAESSEETINCSIKGSSYRVQDGLVHINRQLQSNLSGEEEREIGRPISVSNFHFRTVKRPNRNIHVDLHTFQGVPPQRQLH